MTTPDTPNNLAPEPFLVLPCPHRGRPRDLTARISGDVVLCPQCGGAFTVHFRAGGIELTCTSQH